MKPTLRPFSSVIVCVSCMTALSTSQQEALRIQLVDELSGRSLRLLLEAPAGQLLRALAKPTGEVVVARHVIRESFGLLGGPRVDFLCERKEIFLALDGVGARDRFHVAAPGPGPPRVR